MINDHLPLNQDVFGNVAAYVMQDDILYSSFTPREALTFAARLKLGGSADEQDKRVEQLLVELSLVNIADTLIGSVLRKTLSGGERKRTAIGVELITDPMLLLLDEPTSGLDSFKALQIVKLLDKQAKKGKTVITTIHQPSSEAFSTFNRLILMMDGYIVYQGLARESPLHFGSIGYSCPIHKNPSDYFMGILSVNYPKTSDDEKLIKSFNDAYSKSILPNLQINAAAESYPVPDIRKSNEMAVSTCFQFRMLMYRN
jgi:ATP-binding cassette, subfamily G (WHITE), eye pigment precursor transporter